MLALDYNAINLVGSRRGKRKATLVVEDQCARDEKRAKQVSQSLLEAARKGDLHMCIQAIRDGADVSFQSCEYLMNCGAIVNEKNLTGVTPLAKAIESNRPDVLATVQCLLKYRADTNIADSNGNTPLIKAVKAGNPELVKVLVGHTTTDVNKQNNEKNTALHEAAWKGSKELVEILIAARADVSKQNSSGKTPLHRAVSGNHIGVIRTLLDKGADINVQDSLGYTACHYAAFFGLTDCTKVLVENGAKLHLRDVVSKKTCQELAQERRHYSVVEYLSRVEQIFIPLHVAW